LANNVDAVLDQIEAQQADRFELEPNATSLTLLQKVYRSPAVALTTRMRAAIAALQFEHPKLAVTATINSGDFADQLDRLWSVVEG
jgi:polysaccharide pyruvyl transferase WcaK-like protein